MDWTDFDADKQATIMLSLITQHGRTTSLVWLTVDKDTLKHNRNRYEHTVLVRLAEALPSDVEVLIVADRGFGDHKLYQVLTDELKFDYLIRFRGNIKVTAAEGETRSATDWVGAGGRMRILRGCAVTADGYPVGAVVCVQAKDMKAPWCLCTSLKDVKAKSLLAKYAKRWGIESSFRDTKDPRFGLGMGESRISSPERRDRLWLINALARALMSHRRSRRSRELMRLSPMPRPKRGSLVSRKEDSIPQRLAYLASRLLAFTSLRLVQRHQGAFMSLACTQTTAPTG